MKAFHIIPAAMLLLARSQLGLASSNETEVEDDYNNLEKRCANPCGYGGWLCCSSGQTCGTTSDGQAICLDGAQPQQPTSQWQFYTTTYVTTETDVMTITSTWSSLLSAATATCRASIGETVCGERCCEAAFECVDGQCVQGSSSAVYPTPPVRGTSSGLSIVTETAAVTTTQAFVAPVGTDGATLTGAQASSNNGGLSGGAIAGIIIGVIAGILLLALLLICMRRRARRRTDTTYVEEHYSHHSQGGGGAAAAAAAGGRRPGRTWFGTRPSRPDDGGGRSSGLGSLATIGVVLGAIALCLGLRRREQSEKSDYTSHTGSSSYYYPSDYYTVTESMYIFFFPGYVSH